MGRFLLVDDISYDISSCTKMWSLPYKINAVWMVGTYILVGIRSLMRTTHGCIRSLWVIPSVVSSRKVISPMIEDLMKGTVHIFRARDEHIKTTILLDLVEYVRQYPAVTYIMNVTGHEV